MCCARNFYPAIVLMVLCFPSAGGARTDIPLNYNTCDELQVAMEQGSIDDETFDALCSLLQQPLDIHSATADDFFMLPGISEEQAQQAVAVRDANPQLTALQLAQLWGLTEADSVRLQRYLQNDDEGSLVSRVNIKQAVVAHTPDTTGNSAKPPWSTMLAGQTVIADRTKAGVGVSVRPLTQLRWSDQDQSMSATGASSHTHLDTAYVQQQMGAWQLIIGDYAVGFARRLTFDLSGHTSPDGIYLPRGYRVELTSGVLRPQRALLGAALKWQGKHGNDAVLFVSRQNRDVYQYDMGWTGPTDSPTQQCTKTSECQSGFSCDADGICRSHTIVLSRNENDEKLAWQTLSGMQRETLVGAHAAWTWGKHLQTSVTGFWAENQVLPLGPWVGEMAPNSGFPSVSRFGALGAALNWQASRSRTALEMTRMSSGAWAGVLDGQYNFKQWGTLRTGLRYFGRDFINPYGRPYASSDMTLGSRARNERGAMVRYDAALPYGITWGTLIDFWQTPWTPQLIAPEGLTWQPTPGIQRLISQTWQKKLGTQSALRVEGRLRQTNSVGSTTSFKQTLSTCARSDCAEAHVRQYWPSVPRGNADWQIGMELRRAPLTGINASVQFWHWLQNAPASMTTTSQLWGTVDCPIMSHWRMVLRSLIARPRSHADVLGWRLWQWQWAVDLHVTWEMTM